jgi:hypothetical protein
MRFDNTFVRELPGDKESANTLRQVIMLPDSGATSGGGGVCGGVGVGGRGEWGAGWEGPLGSAAVQLIAGKGVE